MSPRLALARIRVWSPSRENEGEWLKLLQPRLECYGLKDSKMQKGVGYFAAFGRRGARGRRRVLGGRVRK